MQITAFASLWPTLLWAAIPSIRIETVYITYLSRKDAQATSIVYIIRRIVWYIVEINSIYIAEGAMCYREVIVWQW